MPASADETARLAALERYHILDTPPETAFDRLTRLTSNLFQVPIAIIGLIDRRRQWYKSCVGLDRREVGRELSFCTHAIRQREVMIVPDAILDARFVDNPLVTGEPPIRFYAGTPLRTPDGYHVGTLCIIDHEPRDSFSDKEAHQLEALAAMVVDELELRSALRQAEHEKHQREHSDALLTHFFSLSHDLFCIADKNGYFEQFNPAWHTTLGFDRDELTHEPFMHFVHPDDHALTLQAVEQLRRGVNLQEFENRYRTKAGRYRWLRWSASAGEDGRIYASARDITDRKRVEQKLYETTQDAERAKEQLEVLTRHLDKLVQVRTQELEEVNTQLQHDAFHDALTDLPNRALLQNRLAVAIQREARDPEQRFALLYLDIDRFKVINDSLGHSMGDALLVAVARRLKHSVRPGDTVARFGGDEFAIILDDLHDDHEAEQVAERILKALPATFELHGHHLHTSASIGVVCSDGTHESAEEILRDADIAMYRAKALGKDRYQRFTPAMRERVQNLLALENDLRDAIDRNELSVHYQPILTLDAQEVIGFEALLRWQHGRLGPISPAEFVPIAEETGVILDLDRWVLRQACQQVTAWHDTLGRPLSISVNLSGHQFMQRNLADTIRSTLEETGLAAQHLKIELTEGTLMQHSETVTTTLEQLKALGINLYLDDFGTGYSSLSYLQRFPVDVLKIDRSFVARMDGSPESAELVSTILAMAKNLNLTVIAEGIETSIHAQQLQALGCGYGQGFYFAKPLPASEVPELLSKAGIMFSHSFSH